MGKKLKRIAVILMSACMCITPINSYADDTESLEQEKEELEQSAEEAGYAADATEEELAAASEKLNAVLKEINSINAELKKTGEKLTATTKQIADNEELLEKTEEELEQAKTDLHGYYEQLKGRIQMMYELDRVTYLEILLQSGGLADFFSRYEYISEMVSYDNAIMNHLEECKGRIEDAKETIEATTEQLEKDKAEQMAAQANLEKLLKDKEDQFASLEGDVLALDLLHEQQEAEQAAVLARISDIQYEIDDINYQNYLKTLEASNQESSKNSSESSTEESNKVEEQSSTESSEESEESSDMTEESSESQPEEESHEIEEDPQESENMDDESSTDDNSSSEASSTNDNYSSETEPSDVTDSQPEEIITAEESSQTTDSSSSDGSGNDSGSGDDSGSSDSIDEDNDGEIKYHDEDNYRYIPDWDCWNTWPGIGTGELAWPCNSTLATSLFGYRIHPIYGDERFHAGLDLGAGYGSPITACMGGTVIYTATDDWGGGYGNYVQIDHGNGFVTLYAHMSEVAVEIGDYVDAYQTIGYVGSTGVSTGPHLHLEVYLYGSLVDPEDYL